jgi:hypothetical protein
LAEQVARMGQKTNAYWFTVKKRKRKGQILKLIRRRALFKES